MQQAQQVNVAIGGNCAKNTPYGKTFACSVDAQGKFDIYDESPVSLQPLAHLGFCSQNNDVYQNTIGHICSPKYEYSFSEFPVAEIGCTHALHPWVLSFDNSLLCGFAQTSLNTLQTLTMDVYGHVTAQMKQASADRM